MSVIAALAAVAVGAWLSFGVGFAVGDALARSYSALVTVRSASPHLAAIGFIWPPLSTVLQIPLMVVPASAVYAFSGAVVSAAFAGLTAAVLVQILARAGIGGLLRWLVLLLFFTNPFIAFYAANGMSEMPFVFCFVAAVYCYLRFMDSRDNVWIIVAALATSLMLLVRYDAGLFSIAFAAAIALVEIRSVRRDGWSRLEALVATYLVPPVMLVGLPWMFANFQVTGDALYFLHSEYSNTFLVRDVAAQQELADLRSSPVALLEYLYSVCLAVAPFLPLALAGLAAVAVRRRSLPYLGLFGVLLVVPAFQFVSYLQGQTFGFLRFYITLTPAALIAACELIRLAGPGALRRFAVGALLVGLTASSAITADELKRGVDKPQGACGWSGNSSAVLLDAVADPSLKLDICRQDREMGEYIRANFDTRSILADVSGNSVVLFSGRPALFILLSDLDFDRLVDDANGPATYILTSRTDTPEFRALDRFFPQLQEAQPGGLELVHEVGMLRLYRILDRGS